MNAVSFLHFSTLIDIVCFSDRSSLNERKHPIEYLGVSEYLSIRMVHSLFRCDSVNHESSCSISSHPPMDPFSEDFFFRQQSALLRWTPRVPNEQGFHWSTDFIETLSHRENGESDAEIKSEVNYSWAYSLTRFDTVSSNWTFHFFACMMTVDEVSNWNSPIVLLEIDVQHFILSVRVSNTNALVLRLIRSPNASW